MTAAERLRAAVEAALPCVYKSRVQKCKGPAGHDFICPAAHRERTLAAVLPIVEELEANAAARERSLLLPENALMRKAIDERDTHLEELERERDAEIARLRAVLEWAATILTADRDGPGIAWRYMPDELRAALHGDWPAVRAAGVALPEPKP